MRDKKTGRFLSTHGLYQHPFYAVWRQMIGRCENTDHGAYADYGGRGITVCSEWHDPRVFIAWLDSQNYGPGLQIDRIDNDTGYSSDNCRLVTAKENSRNRRDNRRYLIHGEMLMAQEIEEKYGIKATTFAARVRSYGQSPEEALINKRKLPQSEWEINGRMMSAKEISSEYGISTNTFSSRVNRGWPAQRAAMMPVRG